MLPDLPKAESQTVEFKTNFNEDVPQTLTAFANAKGGSVFVGVIPEVDELDIDGRTVVRLSIAEYPVKPVACRHLACQSAGDPGANPGTDGRT